MENSWRYWLSLFLAFLGMALIVGFVFYPVPIIDNIQSTSPQANSYSSYVGGFIGGFFSLAGVFLLFETLIRQQKIYQHQQFETRFYELVNIHHKNVSDIISFDIWDGKNDSRMSQDLTKSGRQYFRHLLSSYKANINSYKSKVYDDAVSREFYYQVPAYEYEGNEEGLDFQMGQTTQTNGIFANTAQLPGYGEAFHLPLNTSEGQVYYHDRVVPRTYFTDHNYKTEINLKSIGEFFPNENSPESVLICEPKPVFNKEEFIDIFWHYEYYGNDLGYKPYIEKFLGRFNKDAEQKKQLARFFSDFYNSDQDVACKNLDIYYRHLFGMIHYIDTQNFLSRKEKQEFVQIIRSQLTTDELAILFMFSLSTVSDKWQLPALKNKNWLIHEYDLFINLPADYIIGFDPKDYFLAPNVSADENSSELAE